jgi:hypothetical protein
LAFDDGFATLEELVDREGDQAESDLARNEAQTRFDLVDVILRDVLHWPADKIRVEQRVEAGYTDYELVDTGTLAVVEAKRESIGFVLPLDLDHGTCALAPLIADRANKALRDAMQQVIHYASLRGVAPCVVTNGYQWVAFLGTRTDGVAPLAGKALIFPSLASIREHFVTFYNCLSYAGIRSKRIFTELSIGSAAPPAPLSASLLNYPGIKRRNPLQSNLQIMGEIMLEDMPQEERYSDLFLRECYASSGALSSYAEISRELLTSRNAALLDEIGATEAPASLKTGVNPALSDEALAAAASHRPIVLLGGVGSGKSTFIQHLIKVDAQAVFQDAIAISVDYGRGATFQSPSEYAVDRIRAVLLEDFSIDIDDFDFVKDLYRRDLQRFDRGVYGQLREIDEPAYMRRRIEHLERILDNRAEHLRRSITRITKTRRQQVVVFLDNVDQRDHHDQNQVFLAANELASSWDATVFVTLRPETYFESQRYGAVSGYHPRVFAISPPRSDVMLQKRIDFALRVLETGGDVRTAGGGLGISSDSLAAFLRVLEHNFSRNRPLLALIDNLAGGNMRRALDFVTQFIGSGHVDTGKIIAVETHSPREYFIPLHEFLRSLIHGDGEHYDPQTSPIANLFSLDRPESRNHFLLPTALDYILSKGDASDSAGYVRLDEVYGHLQGRGFSLDAITFSINYIARFRLIETPLSDKDVTNAERCRITTVGAYTLRNLPSLFTYCDAMIVDTPILHPEPRSAIRDVHSLPERLERVRTFLAYLDGCWEESGLQGQGWSWPTVAAALGEDVQAISSRTTRPSAPSTGASP